jgi:hypothetical protein
MSAFDSNRDGYLDPSERQDAREFQAGDVTRDGALNFNEFVRVEGKLQKRVLIYLF